MHPNAVDYDRALTEAFFYRDCGWNALPSRMDRKGPALDSYADFWETPLPDSVYEDWRTTNIQVMTGSHWNLCVVDCDGDEAHGVWRQMRNAHGDVGPTPTWVARTGGGGWHYWFTLPAWLDECPSRRLWGLWDTWGGPKHAGDWSPHKEIRLLADRALVIAPPSVHVKTGRVYDWVHWPARTPAPAPAWLLDLPAVVNPRTTEVWKPPTPARPAKASVGPATGILDRDEVLNAIPDKIALAASWGLRIASQQPNARGWVACHAIDREDRTASASISAATGVYSECRDGTRLSLFDLAVALGAYPDWQTAKADLAARFGVPPRTR